ncbi:chemotaxis protein CheD [Pseudomonas sp. 3A(2025)]
MSVSPALFLRPGDYFFGRHNGPVTTLLGSCVSIILWHPRWKLLAVSHYVLPKDPGLRDDEEPGEPYDTRYGMAVFQRLHADMLRHGTNPAQYRKSIFGGGTLTGLTGRAGLAALRVGHNNSEFARQQFEQRNWPVDHCDLSGEHYRRLSIDGVSGRIDCQRKAMRLPISRRLSS